MSTFTFELQDFDVGSYDFKGMKRSYCLLNGRMLSGRWARVICFDGVADDISSRITAHEKEKGSLSRLYLSAEGDWREQTPRQVEGSGSQPLKIRGFFAERIQIATGPALDLAIARRELAKAMEIAEALRRGGDFAKAYEVLEAQVAAVARLPIPSRTLASDHEHFESLVGPVVPERDAVLRFQVIDAIRGGHPIPVSSLLAMASPPASVGNEILPDKPLQPEGDEKRPNGLSGSPEVHLTNTSAPVVEVTVDVTVREGASSGVRMAIEREEPLGEAPSSEDSGKVEAAKAEETPANAMASTSPQTPSVDPPSSPSARPMPSPFAIRRPMRPRSGVVAKADTTTTSDGRREPAM